MRIPILRRAPRMLAPVARLYGHRLDQYGATAKGVFWRDERWQRRRFESLCHVFSAEDEAQGGVVINDFGCGYGAFFDYLAGHPVMRDSRYYGYDIVQGMIAACRDRIDDPRANFIRDMKPAKTADYGFASGTYNLNGRADPDDWADYVAESLQGLWRRSRKAMAFNMLRRDAEEKYQGLYYIDPDAMLAFCRRHLSAETEMVDERPMPDVTFFVWR